MQCRSHEGMYYRYGLCIIRKLNIGLQADRWPLTGGSGPLGWIPGWDLALFDPLASLALCLPLIRRRRALFHFQMPEKRVHVRACVYVVTVLGMLWETLMMTLWDVTRIWARVSSVPPGRVQVQAAVPPRR